MKAWFQLMDLVTESITYIPSQTDAVPCVFANERAEVEKSAGLENRKQPFVAA
jgi:hypothetical protein